MNRLLPMLLLTSLLAAGACAAGPSPMGSAASAPTAAGAHRYQPPPALNDGWTVAHAQVLGLDPKPLERMTEAIRRGNEYRNIHSVLVVNDGRLVYEEYFVGEDEHGRLGGLGHLVFDRDTRHDLRSVTKSVVSALVGIAVGSGAIRSLDQSILDYFPEHADLATPERRAITVRHALEMTAGLAWNEWGSGSYGDSTNMAFHMNRSADPIRFVLEQGVVAPPGARWSYNGGLTHLLAEVVRRATGRPLLDFAHETLFGPLGITDVEWYNDRGRTTPDADSGLRLRPRDLAKFGLLFEQRGQWNGRQIVPADWVDESLRRRIALPDSLVELGEDATGEVGYAYHWFHARYLLPYGRVTAHRAAGNGGQLVFIHPEHRLVAVVTAGRYDDTDDSNLLVLDRVLPWALGVPDTVQRRWRERPVRLVHAGEWPEVALSAAERARYSGSYRQDGVNVRVWEESGLLRIADFPGLEGGVVHLIPLGDHVFAFGRYEDGKLTRIYWPDGRLEFRMGAGRATGYIDRTDKGHVFGTAERVQ
ncbi:MAG: serine hydrolase domain-containing protein [Gemmatimonadaceae bacterium]